MIAYSVSIRYIWHVTYHSNLLKEIEKKIVRQGIENINLAELRVRREQADDTILEPLVAEELNIFEHLIETPASKWKIKSFRGVSLLSVSEMKRKIEEEIENRELFEGKGLHRDQKA